MSYYNLAIWSTVYHLFLITYSILIFLDFLLQHFFKICLLFIYLIIKNFLRPICIVSLRENILIFWYSQMITNSKYRILVILLNTILNIHTWFNTNRFYFHYCMICVVVFLTISSNLSYVQIFWYHSYMLVDLTLQRSDKSLRNNTLFCCVYRIHFNATVTQQRLHYLIVKITTTVLKTRLIQAYLL